MRVVIYNETNTRSGPSDRDRTCGLMVPNHPRSQLRHTRISIQFFFFAWKWDKLWSNANSTPFCVFIKCRKSALLKGFRDFCKITAIPAGHAPKQIRRWLHQIVQGTVRKSQRESTKACEVRSRP